MKNLKLSFSTLTVFVTTILISGSALSSQLQTSVEEPSRQQYIPATGGSPVNIEFIQSGAAVELTFSIPGIEWKNGSEGVEWRIHNEGLTNQPGMPQLPVIGRWVRVPENGRLELYYNVRSQKRVADQPPVMDVEPDGIFPPEPVVMSQPMIMRGIRIVKLTLYPVRWDAGAGEYLVSESIDVEIRNIGGQGVNEVIDRERIPSRAFDRMIDALLVNPPRRDNPLEYPPGGYLLVTNEDPPEGVTEFFDWKYASGHRVEILTFNPDVTDTDGLRGLIREVYEEFNFEYLVLFGSEDADPPLQIPYHMDGQDWFYDIYFAQLEGEDMLPDVAVGTFNCLSEGNLICAVRRAISYQSEPYIEETDWYTKAGVGVGACSVPDDLSPSYTGKWVAEVLSRNGFDDITTSFYSDNEVDDPTPMVRDLYNSRTNFILVRAHQSRFDADEIEETGVYPFHFLVSSGTLHGAWSRAFRMGDPDDMRGPSAGFGHYSSPRTNIANALAGGLMEGLFFLDLGCYGWARNYAVANLARVMPADGVDLMPYYYSHWQYWGDPGQWCWTGVPEELEVRYDNTFDPDQTTFPVRVIGLDDDEPITGAIVCITQDGGINLVRQTDAEGRVNFTFESGNMNENDLRIVVTGENLYPHSGVVESEDAEILLVPEITEFSDEEEGDGDGVPEPGETVGFLLWLRNRGEEVFRVNMDNMSRVIIGSLSLWAESDENRGLEESIEPGQQGLVGWFEVRILDGCPDGEQINMGVEVVPVGFGDECVTGFSFEVEAPKIGITVVNVEDDLEPGSDAEINVNLINHGRQDAPELTARLVSLSPFVQVIANNCRYPEIPVDEEVEPQGDNLMISAAEVTIPGSIAEFGLIVDGDPGVRDTLYFSLPVGEAGEGDPLGPDSYGYIALDDGDDAVEWPDVPEYNWLDINEWHGEVEGQSLNIGMEPPDNDEADSTVLVELPFPLRYYGEEFGEISVCSNGWIAVGDQTTLKNQQNWVMPGFDGAYGMMAVFWDRIHYVDEDDGVFIYHDENEGRFIIQWDCYVEDDREPAPNIFQAIFFDPDRYPTPTGDNRIIFQYNTVNNVQGEWEANYHCTVGISSPDGKDGLQYTYWNDYPPQCAPLQNERAILWTTNIYDFETGSVYGRVTRYIDSTAVADMMVYAAQGLGALADENGEYRFDDLLTGPYQFTCGSQPYGTVIQEVEVVADEDIELDFVLPHGWIDVVQDSIYHEWELDPFVFLINLTNTGNAILAIDSLHSDIEYIQSNPHDVELEPDEEVEFLVNVSTEYDQEPGRYEYTIFIANNSPTPSFEIPLVIDVLGVDERSSTGIPDEFVLTTPYPNPFNSSTTVRFGVPVNAEVELSLFDLSGRRIVALESKRFTAGWHRSVIDASGMATGLYFIRMEASDFRSIQRVLLVR